MKFSVSAIVTFLALTAQASPVVNIRRGDLATHNIDSRSLGGAYRVAPLT